MQVMTVLARLLFIGMCVWAATARAEDYPQHTVRLVVPNPPGGGNDVQARLIAEKLAAKWGQPVIVDNRAGGAGNIGAAAVFHSPPDGYTFLITTPAPLVTNKTLYARLAYDPDRFVPVSLVTLSPNLLVVNPKLPIKSVHDLIEFARAHPDRLTYASQGAGTGAHLTTEMMKMTTGVKITHVPYTGTAPALIDLLSGRVDMMFIAFGDGYTYVHSGQLRALAVGGDKRNPLLPDVPTVAEA
jgi:tripartite-type tricarboxylate transporter receptor subunit TctC